MNYDVAIIGGGPSGSTVATLLKKYNPELTVAVFEREKFPREHIGESQLPPIGYVLVEMGVWDKVEALNFPIKQGATFRWGNNRKLWDFHFMPQEEFIPPERPGKFEGQRPRLAWQVDRALYDEVLLNHAKDEFGVDVFEETQVAQVKTDGDRVEGFVLKDGREVTARYYLDCSGNAGTMRRALGIEVRVPTKLMNVAFWDYWDHEKWPVDFGYDNTRILVLSIGSGWIWVIPLSKTRASIGFVCPSTFFKESGKSPEEIYTWALAQEELVTAITQGATRENKVRGTKDWSYIVDKLAGENWFLIGECAGFADPILSAGMTLAHTGARECAYTILELDRGNHDAEWLKQNYEENQTRRIGQHIRFGDFWYSANGIFTALEEYTSEIAADAGIDLDPKLAFNWFAGGAFTDDVLGQVSIGGFDLAGARQMAQRLLNADYVWELSKYNRFKPNLEGAQKTTIPSYSNGQITAVPCYVRGARRLPIVGMFEAWLKILETQNDIQDMVATMLSQLKLQMDARTAELALNQAVQTLEVMISHGWVRASFVPSKPRLNITSPREGQILHTNLFLNERYGE